MKAAKVCIAVAGIGCLTSVLNACAIRRDDANAGSTTLAATNEAKLTIHDQSADGALIANVAKPLTATLLYVATKDAWRCRDSGFRTTPIWPLPFWASEAKWYTKTIELDVSDRTISGSFAQLEGDCRYRPIYLRLKANDEISAGTKAVDLSFDDSSPKDSYTANCTKIGRDQYLYCENVDVSWAANEIVIAAP